MQTYPTGYAESHRIAEQIFREILPRRGMAVREEQIALCHEVLDTLYNREISLCEAGVGIGKTLAYLVACILWQVHRPNQLKMPVVISTSSVALQDAINGILHNIQTGESTKPNLQEQLEQTQQEFDRLLEMSLDFDEDTPFLDNRLKKLNNKIKSLKKAIEDSAARQEKARQPEMLLSAKDLQIQEYDDALTARIIEKITVRSRNEIEIQFTGDYKKSVTLR